LKSGGYKDEAKLLESVLIGKDAKKNWESYTRSTFEAHALHIPKEKLRFLQYVTEKAVKWWADRRAMGAVPIGKVAKKHLVLAGGESAPRGPITDLVEADISYRDQRETIVHSGIRASIAASRALYEIFTYENGRLWKRDYISFDLYCQAKFGYAHAHGYRLVKTGRLMAALEKQAETDPTDEDGSSNPALARRLPLNEGQIRPLLLAVKEPLQVACWNHIAETNDPADLTSAIVEDLAKKFVRDVARKDAKDQGVVLPKKAKTPRLSADDRDRDRALSEVERLRGFLALLPEPMRFDPLLDGLEHLVKMGVVIDVESTVVDINGAPDAPHVPDAPVDGVTDEPDERNVA
jgi:hypothetical protein